MFDDSLEDVGSSRSGSEKSEVTDDVPEVVAFVLLLVFVLFVDVSSPHAHKQNNIIKVRISANFFIKLNLSLNDHPITCVVGWSRNFINYLIVPKEVSF